MSWEGHQQPAIEELERRSLPEVAGAFRLVEAVVGQARADLGRVEHRKSAERFLEAVRADQTWVTDIVATAMELAGWGG